MARKTDVNKIENIKKAAIELMIEYGFRGTTIADIAKKAGVSTGYLYRHYESKEALVDDIIETHMRRMMEAFKELFSSAKIFRECINEFVSNLFQWAKDEEVFIVRFVITLTQEKLMVGEFEKKDKEACLCIQKFVELCLRDKTINPKTTMEDFFFIVITLPFKYIGTRILEDNYEDLLSEDLEKRVIEICINALQ